MIQMENTRDSETLPPLTQTAIKRVWEGVAAASALFVIL
jgi:hypothetical protein